jgi:hypothetical protein
LAEQIEIIGGLDEIAAMTRESRRHVQAQQAMLRELTNALIG